MNSKMQIEAISVLRRFLESQLRDISPNWWNDYILPWVSYRNQDRAWRLGSIYLSQMDLSEVLFALKGNWTMISDHLGLDGRYLDLLNHLHRARNAYAHAYSAENGSWDSYDQMALDLLRTMIDENEGCSAA